MITELNQDNFRNYVSSGLKIIFFGTTWCGYCQKQHEVLNELNNIEFGFIDGDKEPQLVIEHGITGFPTFVIYKNGKILNKFSGFHSKPDLMNELNRYI